MATYSDELVLGTGGQVAAVGAEADAADVEIGRHVLSGVVLEDADLFASLDIKDLSRAVAAGGDVLAVVAEADAADDALVGEGVDEVDIEDALDLGVEDGVPVIAGLLVVGGDSVNLEVAQGVSHGGGTGAEAVVGGGMADLRRSISGICRRRVDLRGGRADGVGGTADAAASPGAGRGGGLGRLRAHAVGGRALGVALLVLRLLGVGVRGAGRARRAGGHLVLLRAHLLLLLGGRAVLLGGSQALLVATGHDAAEEAVAGSDGGWLRRAGVLGRTGHTRSRGALASGLELVPEHADFFLVPGMR